MARSSNGIPREVLAQREAQAWALRQKFYTHQRIADELGLERSTVTKMLQRISARTLKKLSDEVLERTAAQIDQLDYLADEAVQAWHRSKEATRNVAKRTRSASGGFGRRGQTEDTLIQTSDMDGDPRYLDVALKALADGRKLLGINAPERTELSGPRGGPVQHEHKGQTHGDVEHLAAVLATLVGVGAVALPDATAGVDATDDGLHPA